jgi:hypothetical protein
VDSGKAYEKKANRFDINNVFSHDTYELMTDNCIHTNENACIFLTIEFLLHNRFVSSAPQDKK